MAGVSSPGTTVHGDGRRHLRPQHHIPSTHLHQHAVHHRHAEPQQASLHILRQAFGVRVVPEPGHHAAGHAAASVPPEAQHCGAVAGAGWRGGASVVGGGKWVGDG